MLMLSYLQLHQLFCKGSKLLALCSLAICSEMIPEFGFHFTLFFICFLI